MILIVDDEKYIRSSLSGLLSDEGYETAAVESAEKAEGILDSPGIELILLDIQMPGKDGITFLDDNRARLEGIPVIVISGRGDIPTAVSAIKLGAYDYIEKPLVPQRILLTVKQALRLRQSLKTEQKLIGHILDDYRIVGQSPAMSRLQTTISKAAKAEAPVLITGENGTGKELVARHIHFRSSRRAEALVVVNCPAVPESLFESELFGHVKGAFTGATGDRTGRFEKADRGTLFLDEIGDLPAAMQGKLLRVLESGQFEKVGSDETVTVEARILAATNRDLKRMAAEGKFREDLYYRLNVIGIEVLPLRDRPEDIPALLEYFLEGLDAKDGYMFSSESAGLLASFDWPGNIRQLRNFVQQIVFNLEPGEIGPDDVRSLLADRQISAIPESSAGENRLHAAVRQFEAGFLAQLYRKHEGNIAAMARELGLDRGNLSKKLKHLKIV